MDNFIERTPDEAAEAITKWCEEHSVTVICTPVAQSAAETLNPLLNKKDGHLRLYWAVEVFHKGKLIYTTPYSAGIGHIEGYIQNPMRGWGGDLNNAYKEICENKTSFTTAYYKNSRIKFKRKNPTVADIIGCLVKDAASYEDVPGVNDFFAEFGYEDIEQGLEVYKACKKIWEILRHNFTGTDLNFLRTAAYQM